jgi:hypothetical protein
MSSKSAISKLQAILIIDLIIVASAAAGYFYITSLPPPALSSSQIQFTGLQLTPLNALPGQPVTVTVNVTNVGSSTGTYSVNMTLDGAPNQSTSVTLAARETKAVNFTITDASEGVHTVQIGTSSVGFTVVSKFTFSDLAINRTTAGVGEPIGISVTVTNRVNETGTYTLTLKVNGTETQTKTGELEGASSTIVLFELVEQTEGTYQVQIETLTGAFTISAVAPPPKPADFQVSNLTVNPEVAQAGATVTVSAKVTNVGEDVGSYSADLTVNGEVKDTKTVQLSGGEMATVTFTLTETTAGTYTISIGNVTGTLTVQSAAASPTPGSTTVNPTVGPTQTPVSKVTLSSMIVRPYEVWAGQNVTVILSGIGSGTEASSVSLNLKVDGEVVETKLFQLNPQQIGTMNFTITAPPLPSGDSALHIVEVNGLQGGYQVVKDGYHTLTVQILPSGDADFTITLPSGVTEKHTTYWSALLPEGVYTLTMPQTDPTGKITFVNWDDGSTDLSRTFTLNDRTTITATYNGGSSCPSLYVWNGTDYVYVSEISNHGWLGYINYMTEDPDWPIVYYRNNPWDYIPLDRTQLNATDGNFNITLLQRWNEIFYLDSAQLVVVDHPANVSVYSTMEEQYLDPDYMGNIYTISNNPLTPVSAVNQNGQNVLPQISKVDNVFTNGTNGIQSPAWNNITWNRITLNLGDLSNASQIKLVVRAIVDWGSGDDYTTWLDKFFAQPVPNGTEVTPPPYMEVKDAYGNWVRVPQSRDFPLPPDGLARTYVVDLTGLFPTNDYSLRISNFWNVTFDYIAVDTTPQQNLTIRTVDPQAYLYQSFEPGTDAATGNFTQYGNVTQLILNPEDMFVIGRQGDAVSLQFPIGNLPDPAPGMIRDYFLNESCWFKDATGNWGFGFDFTVDPLPFSNMTGFAYPPDEHYPNDPQHQAYLDQWNTRTIPEASAQPSVTAAGNDFSTSAFLIGVVGLAAFVVMSKSRRIQSFFSNRSKRT